MLHNCCVPISHYKGCNKETFHTQGCRKQFYFVQAKYRVVSAHDQDYAIYIKAHTFAILVHIHNVNACVSVQNLLWKDELGHHI